MNNIFKLLALGDVCGEAGVAHLEKNLPAFVRYEGIGFVVANGENSASNGITMNMLDRLRKAGVDIVTGGNHIFDRLYQDRGIFDSPWLVRPCNYPEGDSCMGQGSAIVSTPHGRVLVINVQGRVFFELSLDCPFRAVERELDRNYGLYDIAVVDFHAEATSEKFAMGAFAANMRGSLEAGAVSRLAPRKPGQFGDDMNRPCIVAVWGTHTHVPTADEQIFAEGTGYITDIGMTGPTRSCLGIDPDVILGKFLTGLPARHIPANTSIRAQGAVFEVHADGIIPRGGICTNVYRVEF